MKKNDIKILEILLIILILFSSFLEAGEIFQKWDSSTYTNTVNQYDIKFYHFDLNIERTDKNVSGGVLIKAVVKSNKLDSFAFELDNSFIIDSVIANGIKYTNTFRTGTEVFLILQVPVTYDNFIYVNIYYHGTSPGKINEWGTGMCNLVEPANGEKYTFTLSCPFFAYQWFPCKQDLHDLIDSVEMFVTTDTSNKVASNGLLKKVVELGNGKHRFEWKTTYPINYYLIFAAVGKYNILYDSVILPGAKKPLLLQYFVYPGLQNDSNLKAVLSLTGALLTNYTNHYGLYPFIKEKFGICMAPNDGGMEHQTMPLLGDIGASITKDLHCHEMAHQWFGDAVNIATFHDVWLSEGFATYSEYITYENLFPSEKQALLNSIRTSAFADGTGRIYADDTSSFNTIYNLQTVYNKAAAMLRMIRYELNNDTLFFNIIKGYFIKYKFSNVVTPDFESYLESKSGKDFTDFFNQWYYGYGYPRYRVYWNQVSNKAVVKLIQLPTSSTSFKVTADIKLVSDIGDTVIRITQTSDTQYFFFTVSGILKNVVLDPDSFILLKVLKTMNDPSLGINYEKSKENDIEIFPNPAFNKISFGNYSKEINQNVKVLIMDINGKLVYHENKNLSNDNIDISNLENGIYLVEINSPEINCLKKLCVMR